MHGMDHVRNRGRSKFFTCFNPVFADDDPDRDSESSVRRKKRSRRGFAAAMKAVIFKMSPAKKFRNKKSRQDPFRSNSDHSSSSSADAKFVNTNKNSGELQLRTNSNSSSIFTPSVTCSSRSSSRSSSISSNSLSGSERIKRSASSLDLNPQAMKRDGEKCGCTVGMCIFFICLVALVFWGKVFATLTCTSACLLFASCRRHRRCQPENAASGVVLLMNDVDSEEDKKRVVMEGLLERNRPCRVLKP